MLYSFVTALALAACALAQNPTEGFDAITKPTKNENVPAGSTYKITWDLDAKHPGPITIALLGGATAGTLNVVDTIASHVDGTAGSYDWKVASTLGNLATYGIQITLESNTNIFQWGNPFHITGGSGSSTSTGGSAGSTSTGKPGGSTSAASTSSASGSASGSAHATSTTVVVVTSSTPVSIPSSTIVSSTIRGNLSTTATGGAVIQTITTGVTLQPSATKSSPTSVVTNGVASLAAGSFALVGGVAMAVLAL